MLMNEKLDLEEQLQYNSITGLVRKASHPDKQKIRVIGYFL
jgi:hypothetical protein